MPYAIGPTIRCIQIHSHRQSCFMSFDPRQRYVPFISVVLQGHVVRFLVGVVDNMEHFGVWNNDSLQVTVFAWLLLAHPPFHGLNQSHTYREEGRRPSVVLPAATHKSSWNLLASYDPRLR